MRSRWRAAKRRSWHHGLAAGARKAAVLAGGVGLLGACDGTEKTAGGSAKGDESLRETAEAVPLVDDSLPAIPGFDPASFDGRPGAIMEKMDPRADSESWETEARSAEASSQLARLAKLLKAAAEPEQEELDAIFGEGFRGAGENSASQEVYGRAGFVVKRSEESKSPRGKECDPRSFVGDLCLAATEHDGRHVKLKVVRVTPLESEPGFETIVYFQQSAASSQVNARWRCRWSDESPPRLQAVHVFDFEQVESAFRFVDATGSLAGENPSLFEQMTYGAGYWTDRVQKHYFIDSTGHQGIAVGDADGDGLDDLYVAQQGGLPNRLYLRNRDGTLRDVSAAAGVDWMELTHGVLLVDLDNDGDQDLVLAQAHQLLLMKNDGAARFESAWEIPAESNYFSVTAADYDNDGDLDLYACGYGPRQLDEYAEGARAHVPLPYHDSRNGGPNMLLRNDGGWSFSKATGEAGLDEHNDRHSFAASWEDYDNDGDLDLYVANDFGRNNLYRNEGGRFTDVAAALGVEDMSAGMGATWGDYNRDGRMDVYVSNMFSAAGNRVTYQRQFKPGGAAETLAAFQRHARGNSLFQNTGDGAFADVSEEAGVTMGRWAWGAKFADLNNDGWEDLYVANGYITAEPEDDL